MKRFKNLNDRLVIGLLVVMIVSMLTGWVIGRNQVLSIEVEFVESTPDPWKNWEAFMEQQIMSIIEDAASLVSQYEAGEIDGDTLWWKMRYDVEERAEILIDNLDLWDCDGESMLIDALREIYGITLRTTNGQYVTPLNLWSLKVEKALYLAEMGYVDYECERD